MCNSACCIKAIILARERTKLRGAPERCERMRIVFFCSCVRACALAGSAISIEYAPMQATRPTPEAAMRPAMRMIGRRWTGLFPIYPRRRGVQTSHPKFEFASSADVQSKTFVNENTIFRVSFLIITTLEIHLQKDMITHHNSLACLDVEQSTEGRDLVAFKRRSKHSGLSYQAGL